MKSVLITHLVILKKPKSHGAVLEGQYTQDGNISKMIAY